MKHLIRFLYISLNFFAVPLLGFSKVAKSNREIFSLPNSNREDSKKSLLFVEFQMNPYDPLARATDKVWNKVFKPIFDRLEPATRPMEPTTIITHPTTSTISLKPVFISTTTTPTSKPVDKPTQGPTTIGVNQSSSSIRPVTSASTPQNTMFPLSSTNSSSSPSPLPIAPTMSSSSSSTIPPSPTQLLNCIDWLLDWLQSNSSIPLRSSQFHKTQISQPSSHHSTPLIH